MKIKDDIEMNLQ